MTVTVSEITAAIVSNEFTLEDINSIIQAINFRRGQLARKAQFTIRKGNNVKFTSSKLGVEVRGTVLKVNRKFCKVQTPNGLWNVPGHMLTVV